MRIKKYIYWLVHIHTGTSCTSIHNNTPNNTKNSGRK